MPTPTTKPPMSTTMKITLATIGGASVGLFSGVALQKLSAEHMNTPTDDMLWLFVTGLLTASGALNGLIFSAIASCEPPKRRRGVRRLQDKNDAPPTICIGR